MKNKKEKPIGFHAQIGYEMLHRFDYLQLRDEYVNKKNVQLPHIYYEGDERPLTKRKNKMKGVMFSRDTSKETWCSPDFITNPNEVNSRHSYLHPSDMHDTEGQAFLLDDSLSTGSMPQLSRRSTDSGTVNSLMLKLTSSSDTPLLTSSDKSAQEVISNKVTRKYLASQDEFPLSLALGNQPYQIHNRMMGWKLTTQHRRNKLLNILHNATNKPQTGDLDSDSLYEAKNIERLEKTRKLQKRSNDALMKTMQRMITARCREPKYAAEIALQSMNTKQTLSSTFCLDRMNILRTADKHQEENPDYTADVTRTLNSRGYDVILSANNLSEDELSISSASIASMHFGFDKPLEPLRPREKYTKKEKKLAKEALEEHIDRFDILGPTLGARVKSPVEATSPRDDVSLTQSVDISFVSLQDSIVSHGSQSVNASDIDDRA